MHVPPTSCALAATLLTLLALTTQAAPPPTKPLEGHWVLTEQTYGEGQGNLAERIPEIKLEVAIDPTRTEVTLRSAAPDRAALPWPAFVAEGTPVQLELLDKSIDPETGRLRTRYKIKPPTEDGLTLDITEDYALDLAGDTLTGTMTVKMSRNGEPRGGYVLHRRFVRESR